MLAGGSVAASSLLADYPVLAGQAARYVAAGLLLAGWARLRHVTLPRPTGREWSWLLGLAAVGLAACSVLMIEATRVADPAAVGCLIGVAPILIVLLGSLVAGRRPTTRVLLAAAVVAAGTTAAQMSSGTGHGWSTSGLTLSLGALVGVVGTSVLAAPVLPQLGALPVSIYSCGLAGIALFATDVLMCLVNGAGSPTSIRVPTAIEGAALAYLAIVITAVLFLNWYAAVERLGVERAGLFNGLVPIASLAGVAVVGVGDVTALRLIGASLVLTGLVTGLTRQADRDDRKQHRTHQTGTRYDHAAGVARRLTDTCRTSAVRAHRG